MNPDWWAQAASGAVDVGYFGLILFYGYTMWLIFKKYRLDVRLMVVAFAAANLAVVVLFQTDIALLETWRQGAVLPYGVLWKWMDPLWWTPVAYKYVVFGWEMAQTLLLWVFGVRRGRCGWNWVIFAQLFDLGLFMSKNLQTIPAVMFVFLAPVFAPLVVGFFLSKLPFGYAPGSPEWRCVFGDYSYVLALPTDPVRYIPVCGRFSLSVFDYPALLQGWLLYVVFMILTFYAFWVWWVRPNRRRIRGLWLWLRSKLVCDCEDCTWYKMKDEGNRWEMEHGNA